MPCSEGVPSPLSSCVEILFSEMMVIVGGSFGRGVDYREKSYE